MLEASYARRAIGIVFPETYFFLQCIPGCRVGSKIASFFEECSIFRWRHFRDSLAPAQRRPPQLFTPSGQVADEVGSKSRIPNAVRRWRGGRRAWWRWTRPDRAPPRCSGRRSTMSFLTGVVRAPAWPARARPTGAGSVPVRRCGRSEARTTASSRPARASGASRRRRSFSTPLRQMDPAPSHEQSPRRLAMSDHQGERPRRSPAYGVARPASL
jgi:hypothetical protein